MFQADHNLGLLEILRFFWGKYHMRPACHWFGNIQIDRNTWSQNEIHTFVLMWNWLKYSNSTKSTLDTVIFKSTPETVKYMTSTLDTDPPFKGPTIGSKESRLIRELSFFTGRGGLVPPLGMCRKKLAPSFDYPKDVLRGKSQFLLVVLLHV